MTSTKIMALGILIMLLAFALVTATSQLIVFRAIGGDSLLGLAYLASFIFVVGFVVGVIGFFRE